MHRAIQHSLIFATIFILTSAAMGDAFDRTVDQIKILETELEQNQIDIDEQQKISLHLSLVGVGLPNPYGSPMCANNYGLYYN